MGDPRHQLPDNPWNCESQCWIQLEVKAGGLKWATADGFSYKPECADGTLWEDLTCAGKHVEQHFVPILLGPLPARKVETKNPKQLAISIQS